MHEQHSASTTIYAHDGDPTGSSPVLVSMSTDKREEGYVNTASLKLTLRDPYEPRTVVAQMTATELDTLAAAATLQAAILRGGVGR